MNELLLRRRSLMMSGKKPRLPSEYQEVEYLESTNAQWIDTGFYPSNNTRIKTTVCFLQFQTYNFPFGSRRIAGSEEYEVCCAANIGYAMRSDFEGTSNRKTSTYFPQLGTFFEIDKNKSVCKFGSVSVTNGDAIFRSPYTLALFRTKYPNQEVYIRAESLIGRIANATIWEAETLVRDFVPCYRKSDHKPGMYDLVNDVFYTNAGTGEFIVGANVN